MRRSFLIAATMAVSGASVQAMPKNVILFVGDGMGLEQVQAAGIYANGATGTLNFELFPSSTWTSTYNVFGKTPDSAAGGTAMATGFKVDNGVISEKPDGADLTTVLELFAAQGKSTGLVTNGYMTDATPAVFGAHTDSRSNTATIAQQYLTASRPNVLLGGGERGMTVADATAAGYTVVTDRAGMQAVDVNTVTHLSGQFGSGSFDYYYRYLQGQNTYYDTNPRLKEMTSTALSLLEKNTNGFFLMVENEKIDSAGESTTLTDKTQRSVTEIIELSHAVQEAINWANGRSDTLIIVTADHQTGHVTLDEPSPTAGVFPTMTWLTNTHTSAPVPLFAAGPNAELAKRLVDDTDVFRIMTADSVPLIKTVKFRRGEDGYAGASDTLIRTDQGTATFGSDAVLQTDLDDGGAVAQGLLRFEDIFGEGPGQVPPGARILSAKLIFRTGDDASAGSSTTTSLYAMQLAWDETTATWDGLGGPIIGQGLADSSVASGTDGVFSMFDVTQSLQAWSDGATNYGWALLPDGTNGWQWSSSEWSDPAMRPMLEVSYVVPEPSALLMGVAGLGLLAVRRRR